MNDERHHVGGQFPWKKEHVERMQAAYAGGESWTIVAEEFGITRNSVIGKAHRLGLFKGAEPPPHYKRKAKPPPPPKPKPPPKIVYIPPPLKPPVIMLTKPDKSRPCVITELREAQCRWPLWTHPDQAPKHYCGRMRTLGPYCATHADVAYQPLKNRDDSGRYIALPGAVESRPRATRIARG